MMDDLESLVALNLSGMVGAALHRRLVDRFGSARAALAASAADLKRVPGVGELTSRAILEAGRGGAALKEIELAATLGVMILPFPSPAYPAPLKMLHDPPLVLYVKGDYAPTDAVAIGVVGSRKCTSYGERQASRFATDLAGLGVTIVSGLARGVDTKAHIGAMRARGGRTIAVLGSGLDRVYPAENERLFRSICDGRGCAVSEFPLRAAPEPANFPRRNRIISGLSLGILVIEAAEKSGALITADWALEQAREIFCVPGSVENPLSRGTNRLIQQGARLVQEAADVVDEIPALTPLLAKARRAPSLTSLERAALGELKEKPRTAESVAAAVKLPAESIAAALGQLAAKGLAEERDGEYRRAGS